MLENLLFAFVYNAFYLSHGQIKLLRKRLVTDSINKPAFYDLSVSLVQNPFVNQKFNFAP